jgi:hypothetical protein
MQQLTLQVKALLATFLMFRPIVLMTHEWVPEDFARKFANLPNKQTKA